MLILLSVNSAFDHFDASDRENFCAAVLLLAMEVDDAARGIVSAIVRHTLGLASSCELVQFGREARLAETDDDNYARVDLWLLFREGADLFYAFIEVKTHDRWDAAHVAHQVRDQAQRTRLATSTHRIAGSLLLAPTRLCDRVGAVDALVRCVPWRQLVADLRAGAPSPLVQHVIRHLEAHVDRTTGIADRTLTDFEQATTTVACLRQFLLGCVTDIHGDPGRGFNTTPGDGQALRYGKWAWFGISVPFTLGGTPHRLGLYKYVETPPGDESARETLWLEAYAGDEPMPVVYLRFDSATLAPAELDRIRTEFSKTWSGRGAQVEASVE